MSSSQETKRKYIPINIVRQLWSQCGGFCQNPHCNRYLFSDVEDEIVSLANLAHIIGHGVKGPRSEHELANYIDKDGFSNLIMLCLICHKIVDELEKKHTVEQMTAWKTNHEQKIQSLFKIPNITDERRLLIQVNELLDENHQIFEEYGPFSVKAFEGNSGDAIKIWRKKCLETILPNNQKIIDLIVRNRNNFPFPWDIYLPMMGYKLHSDAFRDNCLLGQKVNDYKLFPLEFDYLVKSKLGIACEKPEIRHQEELEFRKDTVSMFIERFLVNHTFIEQMEKLDIANFIVILKDKRILHVFATNTYYFTEYTFDKVMSINPEIDVIICSSPYATYSNQAKQLCIENNIGLFMLREFMGAISKQGDEFLNYLVRDERDTRLFYFSDSLRKQKLPRDIDVYLFGSYLRRKSYRDIDVILVYRDKLSKQNIELTKQAIRSAISKESDKLDFTVSSLAEFEELVLTNDNRTKI